MDGTARRPNAGISGKHGLFCVRRSRLCLAQDELRKARWTVLDTGRGLGDALVELVHFEAAVDHGGVRITSQASLRVNL